MYFIIGNNRIYRWAAHTKPIFLYAITITATLAITVGIYIAYYWINIQINTDQAELMQLNNQYIQLMSSKNQYEKERSYTQTLKLHNAQYNYARSDDFTSDQVNALISHAKKTGVTINNLKMLPSQNKKWYNRQDIQLGFSGPFDSIGSFMTALKKESALTQCKQFSCSKSDNSVFTGSCIIRCISKFL